MAGAGGGGTGESSNPGHREHRPETGEGLLQTGQNIRYWKVKIMMCGDGNNGGCDCDV